MSTLKIGIRGNQTRFRPGDTLEGMAFWRLDAPPEAVEICLHWFTQGKGTRDGATIEMIRFPSPGVHGTREFRFHLPPSPYSFSGKLISLTWAVALVVKPGLAVTQAEFTMSPTGGEIVLPQNA